MAIDSLQKIQEIMREVFDDEDITLSSETTADDIDIWDSLNHIRLIVAIEEDLEIELPMERVNELRNVGELVNLVEEFKN